MQHEPLIGLPTWLKMAIEGEDLEPFVSYLLDRAQSNEHDASAFLDLSYIAQLRGQKDWGMALQLEALKQQQIFQQGSSSSAQALKIFSLMMPGSINDNTAIDCLLESYNIDLQFAFVGDDVPWMGNLPEHHVLFNAIGNRAHNTDYLAGIAQLFDEWAFPVVNAPSKVLKITPAHLAQTLTGISGIRHTQSDPAELMQHNNHFLRYRLFFVGDSILPHSIALVENPGTSYFESDMLQNAEKQAMEQELLASADEAFFGRYQEPLIALHQALNLDYLAVDICPLNSGELHVQMVDNACIVHNHNISSYHAPYQQEIVKAFYALLEQAKHWRVNE